KDGLAAEGGAVAFAPNGTTVAGGLADNSIRLFNAADGKELKNISGHSGAVTSLAFAPKGDLLASAAADKTVRLWAADGAAKGKLDLAFAPVAVSIGKDGSRLAVGGEKTIARFTLADTKPAGPLATPVDIPDV